MSKKVALYCRVSTGNQSTGLEAQVRALREYCSRNNVNDYVIYEDENQSGVKQSRPALDRMMKDVRDGLIEKVIVYSFSRYARSVTHLLRALEEFKKSGVGFVSITESIDTNTPLGSAVFTILGAVAHYVKSGVMWRESIKPVIFKLLTVISLHITTASLGRACTNSLLISLNDGPPKGAAFIHPKT